MVLIVSQLDLQALSKFNYCHIYFDSPRYCIRSCKLNSYLSNSLDTVQLTPPKITAGAYTPAVTISREVNTSKCLLQNKFY